MLVKIVPDKDWEIIIEYLNGNGAVLIKESLVKEIGLSEDDLEDCSSTYDFGGDADMWVDLVSSKDHYFLCTNKE